MITEIATKEEKIFDSRDHHGMIDMYLKMAEYVTGRELTILEFQTFTQLMGPESEARFYKASRRGEALLDAIHCSVQAYPMSEGRFVTDTAYFTWELPGRVAVTFASNN